MDLSTALALLASAFLGTAVVIANVGLRYLDPARGALVSIPSTTLLFWLLAVFLFRGEGWNATAFAIFAVVGLIFPALVTFLNFASNRLTGPTVAGTISSTTPLFAVFGAIFFLGEPLSPAAMAGTAAIVLGVVALMARDAGFGNWTAFLNAVAAGAPPPGDPWYKRFAESLSISDLLHRTLSIAFLNEANDIAVSVSSASKVDAQRQPAPVIHELACDHLSYFSDKTSTELLWKVTGIAPAAASVAAGQPKN